MSRIVTFDAAHVLPDPQASLRASGMVAGPVLSERISALLDKAADLFRRTSEPRGIIEEISSAEFETVYLGEGRNEPRTPVGDIHARAEGLALFAVTLGDEITRAISRLFEARDFALGAILDALASAGADASSDLAGRTHLETLVKSGAATATSRALIYSPGYCGWHISGQKRLFERLRPAQIGITLGESFLMQPLKSVSGVILAGAPAVHDFADTYSFCRDCLDRPCRARIESLTATRKNEGPTWRS